MADPTAEEIAAQKEREEVSGEIFDGKQESFASKEEEPLAGIDPTLLKTINNLASKVEGLSNFGERLKQTENRIGALSNKEAAAKKRFDELEEKKRLEEWWLWNVNLQFKNKSRKARKGLSQASLHP